MAGVVVLGGHGAYPALGFAHTSVLAGAARACCLSSDAASRHLAPPGSRAPRDEPVARRAYFTRMDPREPPGAR